MPNSKAKHHRRVFDPLEIPEYLCDFDFRKLDEVDPAAAGGWVILYNREIPGEVRLGNGIDGTIEDIGTVEPLNLKILLKGSASSPEEVKVEMTSENDLFLHW